MRVLFSFALSMLALNVVSQDFHYTQYDRAMLILDPSSAGNFNGYERFIAQNRNQWIGAGTRFMTTLAAAEFKVGQNGTMNKSFVGIGTYFMNDIGGDSKFGNTTVGASLSGNLPLTKQSKLSAGIQTAFTNRSADFSNLLFYSQWNGTELDPTIPTNEPNQLASFSFLDAGAGFSYSFSKKNASSVRGKAKALTVGVLGQHLNAPKLRYNSITLDRLKRKFGLHLETELGIRPAMSIEFKTAQFFQGKHYEGLYGIFYKVMFKNNAELTKLINDSWLSAGLFIRSTGTIAPTVYVDLNGFRFGFSYDQEMGKLARAYRSSLEFSLSYTFSKYSMFHSSKIH